MPISQTYLTIYIDFLLLNKPILLLPYDLQKYKTAIGINFDYDRISPGPKPKIFKSFKEELLKLLEDRNYYRTERVQVNNFFNEIKEDTLKKNLDFLNQALGDI